MTTKIRCSGCENILSASCGPNDSKGKCSVCGALFSLPVQKEIVAPPPVVPPIGFASRGRNRHVRKRPPAARFLVFALFFVGPLCAAYIADVKYGWIDALRAAVHEEKAVFVEVVSESPPRVENRPEESSIVEPHKPRGREGRPGRTVVEQEDPFGIEARDAAAFHAQAKPYVISLSLDEPKQKIRLSDEFEEEITTIEITRVGMRTSDMTPADGRLSIGESGKIEFYSDPAVWFNLSLDRENRGAHTWVVLLIEPRVDSYDKGDSIFTNDRLAREERRVLKEGTAIEDRLPVDKSELAACRAWINTRGGHRLDLLRKKKQLEANLSTSIPHLTARLKLLGKQRIELVDLRKLAENVERAGQLEISIIADRE